MLCSTLRTIQRRVAARGFRLRPLAHGIHHISLCMSAFTTGVLLTYYEPYRTRAIAQFEALLESLPGQHALVVVNNGPADTMPMRVGITVIAGNNSHREFSGWDAGLAYCRESGLLEKSDLTVFANDTFCHHNKFGPITRFAFARAFRRLLQAPAAPALTGEIHALGKPYQIDGLTGDRWVATYLFGISRGLLERLEQLTPAIPMADFYRQKHHGNDNEDTLEFSDLLSPNLVRHVEQWLLGSGNTRWQGGSANGPARTLVQLQGKANSVLCEKYLTAVALARGAVASDVFASASIRRLRRIEILPKKLAALLGRESNEIYGG